MGVVLAGVSPVEWYDNSNNLVMTAKVPTDSALNATATEDVIRGGNNNKRISSYFYDSNLSMTVTSPTFDKKFLTNKLGSVIVSGSNPFYVEAITTSVANTITVEDYTPVKIFDTDTVVNGWYKLATESDEQYKVITFTNKTATVNGLASGTAICVKYVYLNAGGSSYKINSEIIPNILRAVMKIPMLKGDSENNFTNSSKIGEMLVKIPQYQFDPNAELALTSSGHASISLSGNALENEGTGCDANGYYATIDETFFGVTEFGEVDSIVIDGSDIELAVAETQTIDVVKIFNTTSGKLPDTVTDYSLLTFVSSTPATATISNAGLITGVASGTTTITVTVTGNTKLVATALVTVA